MERLRQFIALAGLTAAEGVRQPVFLLLTTTAVALTGLTPISLMHQFGEEGRMARDTGLALQLLIGLAVAAATASNALTRERAEGTAAALLSKPVDRAVVFLGKYAGVATVILGFSACCLLATLMAERVSERFWDTRSLSGYVTDYQTALRMLLAVLAAYAVAGVLNYATRRPFASTAFRSLLALLAFAVVVGGFFDQAGRLAPFGLRVDWRILPAAILVTMALLLIAAVALVLAVRLGTAATLAACGALLVTGLVSPYIFGRHAHASAIASVLYRLIPDWQHFWMPDALRSGGVIPWSYTAKAAACAACYTVAVLGLGAWLFRRAETA
jgi:ABC-type transport system involved in multi-copper enzyme maturation permease subunit